MKKSNQQSYPVITPRNHNSKQNTKRFWKVQGQQIDPDGNQQPSSWTKGPLNRREIMVNTVSPELLSVPGEVKDPRKETTIVTFLSQFNF